MKSIVIGKTQFSWFPRIQPIGATRASMLGKQRARPREWPVVAQPASIGATEAIRMAKAMKDREEAWECMKRHRETVQQDEQATEEEGPEQSKAAKVDDKPTRPNALMIWSIAEELRNEGVTITQSYTLRGEGAMKGRKVHLWKIGLRRVVVVFQDGKTFLDHAVKDMTFEQAIRAYQRQLTRREQEAGSVPVGRAVAA